MRLSSGFLLIALAAGLLAQQPGKDLNDRYRTPEGREGIARNLGSEDRVNRMKPAAIAAKLDLKPGMTVADLGTGVGMLLPELSKAVGPTGKVLAEDINTNFLATARAAAKQHGLTIV